MKALAVLVLLCGTLAVAQKKDPLLRPQQPSVGRSSAPASLNDQAVTAALKTKTNTASDLAKIERGTTVPHVKSHTNAGFPQARKNFRAGQNNTNKSMKASVPGKNGGHPVPSVRKKVGKAG